MKGRRNRRAGGASGRKPRKDGGAGGGYGRGGAMARRRRPGVDVGIWRGQVVKSVKVGEGPLPSRVPATCEELGKEEALRRLDDYVGVSFNELPGSIGGVFAGIREGRGPAPT
ncbi:hypothetical protein Esi_0115_0064 [Ectocarpus siliculosus]|uniref:Uncharacterized protein n=1 Tax=Ectocarpus siliculosus TaxID=2880 RepID=D7FI00_ECTSI|nr:hypothetical protein Esi_0115_0064 [Ectocarpus siliculosus]|eukprot:CBJ49011.1 hypothetical protein Esi_0115_0064 [Ectocarpus siliculosus]